MKWNGKIQKKFNLFPLQRLDWKIYTMIQPLQFNAIIGELMYFIYKIEWSQTDQDIVLVMADNKEAAYKKVKAAYPRAFYWQYMGETKTMI